MPPQRSTRPTQRDIAELAGVSITTVSHVVNGTRAVAPETRAAVLEAIEQTGYTGDVIARSLVTGGTRSIGVAISLLANPYFAVLMQTIEREAAAAGYTVLLSDTHDTVDTEQAVVRALRSRRVEGLLLTSVPGDGSVISELVSLGIPTVLVDRLATRGDVDQVGAENIQSTSALTEHLASLGHRRIGFVAGTPGLATSEERTLGYRLGLGRGGLAWNPDLVVPGHSERAGGADAFAALLDRPEPPSAVVVGNDAMMAGVLHEARRRQLHVGKDVAVVGFDDTEWADLVDPPLTTMAQPIADIGREAVRLLLSRIKDPDRRPETLRLPPVLRHRESCGCPAIHPDS
ncbi:LacI family transcriptional regulator [Prauserella sp. PE36]|uniref:LacI family transcriptional regulator n=1 Tax=Prauserella endophytica TaxID=1592324 RepID=A0ABY2SBY7_9PSEU|nr:MULTISPECIES: LacI family DNA-binding transcriptional regulator [Prauserella]PXY34619.1 LacI family transcriptional regulator [Prauserella coralliicola]RBM12927.1 LacI family transcriptional regulator [Prauserella sp. PE36]TKG73157.1 LacI family transcriptional regulator [Prauserella endophytica]